MTSLILLCALGGAPTHDSVLAVVRDRFEAAGRTAPLVEPALDRAAVELAKRALRTSAGEAATLATVTDAVSRNGGWEPSPTALVIRADPEEALPALQGQRELSANPANLVGIGVASNESLTTLCILLVQRKVELKPFARAHAKPPKSQQLCVHVLPPLTGAELFVTRPAGGVDLVPLRAAKDELCAMIDFPAKGRHTVEVLGHGPRGPEVGALFFVDVAMPPSTGDDLQLGPEPTTTEATRAAVLVRTNALRLSMGLAPVAPEPALDAVAQAWAQRMTDEGFFAHIAPDGTDLKARLGTAKYRYSAAGENLGAAAGPLAAHWGIEHSPGHRKNLLEPVYSKLGVGLTHRDDGQAVLVEVLAAPVEAIADPLTAAYDAVDAARRKAKLKALKRSPVLEALAQDHAKEMLARDLPKAELPGRPKLHQRAFELVDGVKAVSVDIAITQSPAIPVESKNLTDAANSQVGIGLVHGDSPKYGADRYWVVLIYAASR